MPEVKQQQQNGIPPSHMATALMLNQKSAEIVTKMATDYENAVAMIKMRDEKIATLEKEIASLKTAAGAAKLEAKAPKPAAK